MKGKEYLPIMTKELGSGDKLREGKEPTAKHPPRPSQATTSTKHFKPIINLVVFIPYTPRSNARSPTVQSLEKQ